MERVSVVHLGWWRGGVDMPKLACRCQKPYRVDIWETLLQVSIVHVSLATLRGPQNLFMFIMLILFYVRLPR